MEKLLEILKKIKPEIDFETRDSLIDDGALDSIELFEVLIAIEDNFSIQIDPNQIDPDNFQSVASMWKMIQSIKTTVVKKRYRNDYLKYQRK